jgi:uncharacterized protein (TIGR03089 family)
VPNPPEDVQSLLAALMASDPGRPRITVYDDTDGPTRGERVELSARVVANWVAKAANLLQDELDAGPGTVVRLALPPHWRTVYWALAAWSVGATVDVRPGGADGPDIVVTDDPEQIGDAASGVLVTLAALARSAPSPTPAGAVDEARELATHGDVFTAYDSPDPEDAALVDPEGTTTFGDLLADAARPGRWHTDTGDTTALLRLVLAAWAADGSVVLTRGTPDADVLERRLASEGVTAPA